MIAKNILITGRPGSGKSTLIQKLRERFAGRSIAGIITPEIRRDNKRHGFRMLDIASGAEEVLASVDVDSPVRISKYFVNVAGADRIVDAFLRSFRTAELIIVDEIGKMELFSEQFRHAVLKILDSDKPVVATIGLAGHPFIERVRRRADVEVINLERSTMDEILDEIAAELDRRLAAPPG